MSLVLSLLVLLLRDSVLTWLPARLSAAGFICIDGPLMYAVPVASRLMDAWLLWTVMDRADTLASASSSTAHKASLLMLLLLARCSIFVKERRQELLMSFIC